jgi:NAD(P)-dependent dehydrogenase (short-subunit alcohol dehydrogenase family)
MGRFEGRSVVVTGASSGIGLAVARRFAAEGALLTLGSRSEADVDGAAWVATDVADPVLADALIAAAVAAHGRVDVIVNCAGVQVEKTVADTSDDEYDLVMGVNVRGTFNCCRAAIRSMRDSGGGCIVNIGSISGDVADHGMAVYDASKGAVHALTRAIAADHGADDIRCNAVAPGWTATAMVDAAFATADDPSAALAAAAARHPVGRIGTPDDIAGLVLWLASDESGFVSGSVFTIDGGLTAGSPIGG